MKDQARRGWGPGPLTAGELPFGADFFKRLLDNLYDGVYFVDRRRRILFWNKGAEQLTGYKGEEVVGSYCYAQILDHVDATGHHLCQAGCPLVKTMRSGQPASERVYVRHKDGRRIAVDVHVMPIRDEGGRIVGAVEIFRDASSVVALETAYGKMRELAEKDPLTGVVNRRTLDAMLTQQVDVLGRTGAPFSVILADIDHFKRINDTWGHPSGDQALIRFSEQLQRQCRSSDMVGRYGGEEFLVILPGSKLDCARRVAERMRLTAPEAAPPGLDGGGLTASFGVTEAAQGDTAEGLLRRVDEALYQAKHRGRNRVEAQEGYGVQPGAGADSRPIAVSI